MQFSSFLLFAVLAVSIARCAPALDAATLSDNAKKAQQLNVKFATLKATDPCQGQETACLDGDIATCVNGKFDTSNGKCAEGQQCFAIPDLRAPGTSLLCTSEITVVGLMKAAGVNGGITGSDNPSDGNNSTSTTTSSTSSTTTSTPPSNSGGLGDGPEQVTVTVTVFASPLRATTTTTVSPSEASSILGKFLTNSQPSSTSSSGPILLTPAAEPSSTPPASGSVSSSGTPSATPLATNSTPSPPANPSGGIRLTALFEDPSPSGPTPTPSAKGVPVGGGGGGYGGY